MYGAAPSYSYLDNTPVTGVFAQPSSVAPSFDSDAAYNQLVEAFSASQTGAGSAPGVLLAAHAVQGPGQPVVMSEAGMSCRRKELKQDCPNPSKHSPMSSPFQVWTATSRPRALALLLAGFLVGCAPAVPVQEAHLIGLASPTQPVRVLQREAIILLSSGYTRKLAEGSRWRVIGSLPQGEVLRPVDSVFTIEGRQVHEAYLVVSGVTLMGFYLPGEEHFSPLNPPLSLTFGEH